MWRSQNSSVYKESNQLTDIGKKFMQTEAHKVLFQFKICRVNIQTK